MPATATAADPRTVPAGAVPTAPGLPPAPPPDALDGSDRLALAVARVTLGLTGADQVDLARRMRLTASAVLLFAAGAGRPKPPGAGPLRRAAARRALQRLAAQVALAERLGHLDAATALALLERQSAVAVALAEPASALS